MYRLLDTAIPKHHVKNTNCKSRFPRWYSTNLVRKIKEKNKIHRLISKKHANPQMHSYFNELRKSIKLQTNVEYKLHKKNLENNINHDPKSFWQFIRDKTKKSGVPREMKCGKNSYSNSRDIANAFSKHFQSVYEQSTNDNTCNLNFGNSTFNFSMITEKNIISSIKKLKPKKSTGPDNIPAHIYKGLSEYIASPLKHIFNLAITNKQFPEDLKTAQITPVYKSGNKNEIKNYRPISLINVLSKIYETILSEDLTSLLKPKMSIFQHGFLEDKSTVTNLTILSELAAEAIQNKCQLDVIYTDCEKAFDKVNHSILLKRLVEFGISEDAYLFLKSYLTDRRQWVGVGGSMSESFIATSGIQQGSNLGPLLFLCFINSLPDCLIHSIGLLFADDFKLCRIVKSQKDCEKLQHDIDNVSKWCEENKMFLNIQKCSVVKFTRKTNPILNTYRIGEFNLKCEKEVKDLGVLFQSNLKFNNHFTFIKNKAVKALGFIIRNSKNFKISTIIKLYNSLVRPHLEYASQIWMPMETTHDDFIEKVQKRFLRYLHVIKYNNYPFKISYKSMLSSFKVTSLSQRRKKQAVIFLYYIIHNLKYKDCNFINYVNLNVPKINLRMSMNRKIFSVDPASLSPFNRMMAVTNEVLREVQTDFFNDSLKELKSVL